MRKSSNSKTVVARMTVTRADNSKVIVEIHSDATFIQFYHFYTQQGNKRSTKTETRTASRIEGMPHVNAHLYTPGLETVRKVFERPTQWAAPVRSIKLRILRRRMYRELLQKAPDVLGLTRVSIGFKTERPQPAILPISLPQGYPSVKRWSILESRASR